MSRIARAVLPGFPHHVTQRGNRGAEVFLDAEDRERYLSVLSHYARRHGVDIWAYCLMSNHVHFVMLPHAAESLARTLRDAQRSHAAYLNAKVGERGHLWHSRYFSCALDESHLWAAVRYVERNPVRAGLVAVAADYPWSSAAPHCGLRADAILSPDFPPPGVIADWAADRRCCGGAPDAHAHWQAVWCGPLRRAHRGGLGARPQAWQAWPEAERARNKGICH